MDVRNVSFALRQGAGEAAGAHLLPLDGLETMVLARGMRPQLLSYWQALDTEGAGVLDKEHWVRAPSGSPTPVF